MPACIYVIAGTNGAGKSSIIGEILREKGADYFNPDEATKEIRKVNPGISISDANSLAWREGKRLLEHAIATRSSFAFETTLGGNTIASLLETAGSAGIEIRMWYVGLKSKELHLERVRRRVKRGGHDIPEDRIRTRYDKGRQNLIRLLPYLTELKLFDNSLEGDPSAGLEPSPKLILHLSKKQVVSVCKPADVPDWAKAIVMSALKTHIASC